MTSGGSLPAAPLRPSRSVRSALQGSEPMAGMSVQDPRGANLRVLAVSFVASTAVMTALSALPDMVTGFHG